MNYIERLEFVHKNGDLLYPTQITKNSSGKTSYHLKPPGLDKTDNLVELEDAAEAIRLVIEEDYSIRCRTLVATTTNKEGTKIKRGGMYSIKGRNIKKYNLSSR